LQDLPRLGVARAQEKRVLRRDDPDAELLPELRELEVHALLLRDLGTVDELEEEIPLAEDLDVFAREARGLLPLAGLERFFHVAEVPAGERDEPFRVRAQKLLVEARLVIKSLEESE